MKRYRAGKIGASVAIAAGVVACALLYTAITPSLVSAPFGIFVLMLGLALWIPFHEYNGWISAGFLGAALFLAGSALPYIVAFSAPPAVYPDHRDLTAAAQEMFIAGLAGGSVGSVMWLMTYRRALP